LVKSAFEILNIFSIISTLSALNHTAKIPLFHGAKQENGIAKPLQCRFPYSK